MVANENSGEGIKQVSQGERPGARLERGVSGSRVSCLPRPPHFSSLARRSPYGLTNRGPLFDP